MGAIGAAAAAVVVTLLWLAAGDGGDGAPVVPPPVARAGLADVSMYRGLGSWVDIYDHRAWADPVATMEDMRTHGVRTLYLQTSNFGHGRPFVYPYVVPRFIEAAHAAGLEVVAWYLPGLVDERLDYVRIRAAVELRTPAGQRFDSFALDIESPAVRDPAKRTARLVELSARLRESVGVHYPLGAIVPSPLAMKANPDYWPGFPWSELHETYDVFLPMTYFTWRVKGRDGARDYTAGAVKLLRKQTNDPSVPVHVIGGISGQATTDETWGFVRAVQEEVVMGASYYGFPGTTEAQWKVLSRAWPNPP